MPSWTLFRDISVISIKEVLQTDKPLSETAVDSGLVLTQGHHAQALIPYTHKRKLNCFFFGLFPDSVSTVKFPVASGGHYLIKFNFVVASRAPTKCGKKLGFTPVLPTIP